MFGEVEFVVVAVNFVRDGMMQDNLEAEVGTGIALFPVWLVVKFEPEVFMRLVDVAVG